MTESADLDVVVGREPPTYTQAQDWVALSGVSPEAHSLWIKLKMHANRERGDAEVWPGADSLAALMGVSRGDKITQWRRELEAIGAIEVRRSGPYGRNVYVVHSMPPEGYTGPLTLKAWYTAQRPALAAARVVAKAKRDARRDPSGEAGAENPQVERVTPKRGEQAVTPKTGERVTPKRGEHVAPKRGREPYVVEPDEVEPPPPARAHTREAADPVAAGGEGGDSQQKIRPGDGMRVILDRLAELQPGWRRDDNRQALEIAYAQGRDPRAIAAAAVAIAEGRYGPTSSTLSARLPLDGPWWADAGRGLAPRRDPAPVDDRRCPEHGGPARWCCPDTPPDAVPARVATRADAEAAREQMRNLMGRARQRSRPDSLPTALGSLLGGGQ